MKRACFICLFQCLTTTFLLSQSNPVLLINQSAKVVSPISASQADPKTQARILDSYGKLPLSFEANQGQTDGRVKFLSRASGYSLFLTGDEAVLTLSRRKKSSPQGLKPTSLAGSIGTAKAGPFPKTGSTDEGMADAATESESGGALHMKLRNANSAAKVTGVDELAGTINYYIGNDPAKWHTKIPTYAKVKYEGIYDGIDLVYYGNESQLEYDFIVSPGADPHRIAFEVSGAKRIRQDGQGELVFKVGEEEVLWHKPVVYQKKAGARQEIAAHYTITDKNRVGFELAKYDTTKPLYIDPLIYSTYLGSTPCDLGRAIAVDSVGDAYVTGDELCESQGEAFAAKINAAGSALLYKTYFGGSSGVAIAVDSTGNAYVTSINLFSTIVAKLGPSGSLLYGTNIAISSNGITYPTGIAVDSEGNAYVTGQTSARDFPVTPGAFQTTYGGGNWDGFVTKLDPTLSAVVYSTYLGGNDNDWPAGIAIDSAGNAYITGETDSNNFPTKNPLQSTNAGAGDAFVTKLNPAGSALIYSTYLGGSNLDLASAIALDGAGNVYITGTTASTDWPTKNPFQPTYGGNEDAFVAKLNPSGSALVYSTYLGGLNSDTGDWGLGIATDSVGNAYVTGETGSPDFPTKNAFQAGIAGLWDAFVTEFNPTGSALIYSTYLGGSKSDVGQGIAVDSSGNIYVTGTTASHNFPLEVPLQKRYGAIFVAKIDIRLGTTTTISSTPNPSNKGQAVTFTAVVTSVIGAPPNGETVTFLKNTKVLGTGTLNGASATFTTSTLPVGHSAITAVYGGDSNFGGSTSKAVKQVVNKATTTTALASSQNPSNVGQSVTFTASVVPQFSGKVTGTVTFYDGTTVLKTVSVSGGAAKFTTKALTAGTHTITATYNGNNNFDGSSASLTQTVS